MLNGSEKNCAFLEDFFKQPKDGFPPSEKPEDLLSTDRRRLRGHTAQRGIHGIRRLIDQQQCRDRRIGFLLTETSICRTRMGNNSPVVAMRANTIFVGATSCLVTSRAFSQYS